MNKSALLVDFHSYIPYYKIKGDTIMFKQLFIDTETTGLDAEKNGILNIGGLVRIGDVASEPFDFFGQPFKTDEVSLEALKVNQTTKEMIDSYQSAEDLYSEFHTFLDKFIDKYDKRDKFFFYGWNADFDDRFLRAFFKKNKDKYYGSYILWPSINVAALLIDTLKELRFNISDFHLDTAAKFMGLEVDEEKRHSAYYDAELTMKVYDLIRKGVK